VTANGPGPLRPETAAEVVSLLADVQHAFVVGDKPMGRVKTTARV